MQGRDLYTQYPKSTARSSRCERRVGQETSDGKPCHINEKSSSLHTCINRLISRSRECRLLRKSSQIRKSHELPSDASDELAGTAAAATKRPSSVSSVLYTTPIPPPPSC